ncbi:MAG TPA: hypothetical protein VGM94_18895 [Galbitalea sp.]|jgi:hypothetical protein
MDWQALELAAILAILFAIGCSTIGVLLVLSRSYEGWEFERRVAKVVLAQIAVASAEEFAALTDLQRQAVDEDEKKRMTALTSPKFDASLVAALMVAKLRRATRRLGQVTSYQDENRAAVLKELRDTRRRATILSDATLSVIETAAQSPFATLPAHLGHIRKVEAAERRKLRKHAVVDLAWPFLQLAGVRVGIYAGLVVILGAVVGIFVLPISSTLARPSWEATNTLLDIIARSTLLATCVAAGIAVGVQVAPSARYALRQHPRRTRFAMLGLLIAIILLCVATFSPLKDAWIAFQFSLIGVLDRSHSTSGGEKAWATGAAALCLLLAIFLVVRFVQSRKSGGPRGGRIVGICLVLIVGVVFLSDTGFGAPKAVFAAIIFGSLGILAVVGCVVGAVRAIRRAGVRRRNFADYRERELPVRWLPHPALVVTALVAFIIVQGFASAPLFTEGEMLISIGWVAAGIVANVAAAIGVLAIVPAMVAIPIAAWLLTSARRRQELELATSARLQRQQVMELVATYIQLVADIPSPIVVELSATDHVWNAFGVFGADPQPRGFDADGQPGFAGRVLVVDYDSDPKERTYIDYGFAAFEGDIAAIDTLHGSLEGIFGTSVIGLVEFRLDGQALAMGG